MSKIAAIPLLGSRVAPRCQYAKRLLLARLKTDGIKTESIIQPNDWDTDDLLARLLDAQVDTFICGGIEKEFKERIESYGIRVVNNVAGDVDEILAELAAGRLHEGFGYPPATGHASSIPGKTSPSGTFQPPYIEGLDRHCLVNCMQCTEKTCLAGQGCIAWEESAAIEKWGPPRDGLSKSLFIASISGAPVCRIEDFESYCQSLKFQRAGIVFCTEAFPEMETVWNLLSDNMQIMPVCCQFGTTTEKEQSDWNREHSPAVPACNPELLVKILNDSDCDVVVTIGPCSEFNAHIERKSNAPVMMMIAKDRTQGGSIYPWAQSCEERTAWRKQHCGKT